MSPNDPATLYGFTAVPANSAGLLPESKTKVNDPKPVTVAETPIPPTALASRIQAYARSKLPPQTFNHSMRVYHYGLAIAREQFPEWNLSAGSAIEETYFLTCMLHDIGTTEENIKGTLMSFEFYGAFIALEELQKGEGGAAAPKAQAEGVAEAIIRHQDIRDVGKITIVGQLVQLATIFDNMGFHKDLVHKETIDDVVKHWPRNGWSGCFAKTIRQENGLKPWAHTTSLGEEAFPDGVLGNKLMEPYD